jgi:tetratricopeptide (TPR) repeat protein
VPSWYGHPDKITTRVYASAYCDTLAPDSAINYCRDKLDDDPNSPIWLNNLGVAYWELGDHDQADRYLRAARKCFVQQSVTPINVVSEALGSVFLFNIGINLAGAAQSTGVSPPSDTTAALAYLDSALQADYLSLRVKRTYLNQIDSLGEQDGNVAVIDLPTIFAKNGGESLFIDHCHPTSEGHRLITQEISETITSGHMLFDAP